MRINTVAIKPEALLIEANKVIRQHEHYLPGMKATEVEQNKDVLIFRGPFFLDEQGLPSEKTPAIFNMFKHLATLFSDKYHLES